jgi:hypothetical protein
MRLFVILYLVALVVFWGLSEAFWNKGTAIQVAETPSVTPMKPDPRLSTFQPVTRYPPATSVRASVKPAQTSEDDFDAGFPDDGLHKYRVELRDAGRALDENPCDAAAHEKARAALEVLAKAHPGSGPGRLALVDDSEWKKGCPGAK